MQAELVPLQAVCRAANTHWRAGAWFLKQLNAQRAAAQDVRYLKSRKLQEFAKNVRWMLLSTISDVDVLRNVLRQFENLLAQANHKPPASKHVAFPINDPPNY